MTVFNENWKKADAVKGCDGLRKNLVKILEMTTKDRDKCFVGQMLEVTEMIEAKKNYITPQLWQIIYDLAHKIDDTPADEMEADDILIIGQDRQEIDNLLVAAEATLRVLRLCEPIRKECGSTTDDDIKMLRSSIDQNRYKYLLLEELQCYPFTTTAGRQLYKLMHGMRVVATMSSEFNQLPQDIKRKFRIQVDLVSKRIFDRNTMLENANPSLTPLQEPPVGSDLKTDKVFDHVHQPPPDELIIGKPLICARYGCEVGSYNAVVRMSKKLGIKVTKPKGENGEPSFWRSQIDTMVAAKYKK